jgi:hypothetical protein
MGLEVQAMRYLMMAVSCVALCGCFYATYQAPEVLASDEFDVGIGLASTIPSGRRSLAGTGSLFLRKGIGGDFDVGAGYSYPLGVHLDLRRQLSREPLLAATAVSVSADRRASLTSDTMAWVFGITPMAMFGTPFAYAGAQVMAQQERLDRGRVLYYLFPGVVAGANLMGDEYPYRVLPEAGLFLDPGLNGRGLHLMLTLGLGVQLELSDWSFE